MIDKIISLTTEKRFNRCWLSMGFHLARGVPKEKLTFWVGETPIHYNNDYNKIADAAEEDGFPFVRYLQGYENLTVINQAPEQMCQFWSYAQILRYISETEQTCLILWDDRFLATPFSLVEIITQQATEVKAPFYMFQLRLRGETEFNDIQEQFPDAVSANLFQAFVAHEDVDVDYMTSFVTKGIQGFDESIIFSPTGADWLLQQMLEMEETDPDLKLHSYFDLSEIHLENFMKCVNIDSFIRYALPPLVQKALAENKGFYCPRASGFNFVAEPLSLGSDTNFLTEHVNDTYHYYNDETQLRFLNR